MWRTTVSDQRRRSLSRPHDEQVGTMNLIRARAWADPVPRFLLRHGYPITSEHESRRRSKSRRKDHRRRGDASAIYFSHCTIAIFFSQPDSRCLRQIFSQFSMATQPMLCSKVVALQTIFTFAIASLVKFPLDHDWIRALSSCNSTVSLNSDSKQSDSPSLDLIISKFLM